MAFLPVGYEVPVAEKRYMKFKLGENKFRAITDAIVGTEYWVKDGEKNKPFRVHTFAEVPAQYRGDPNTKDFWMFLVYNYQTEAYEILEIVQKSVMGQINHYVDDSDWGDPKGYDIVVTKAGDGSKENTKYTTTVKPSKEFKSEVPAPVVNLDVIFSGGDPFKSGEVEDNTKTTIKSVDIDTDEVLGIKDFPGSVEV